MPRVTDTYLRDLRGQSQLLAAMIEKQRRDRMNVKDSFGLIRTERDTVDDQCGPWYQQYKAYRGAR